MGVFLLYYVCINRKVNMADQTQPEIQYVQTKNRAKEYELKQKEKGNPYTLQELKASHHNFMLDCKIEDMIDSKKVENLAYYLETLSNKLKT